MSKMVENELIECACGCGAALFRYDKYGRARRFVKGHGKTPLNINDQFWPYIEKTEACWIWRGTRTAARYGIISRRGERIYAHRLSYELHYGKIPPNRHILHECDNPSCVNPKHLFLGTPLTNTHDAIKKGRKPGGCLTDKDVEEIRELARSGISQSEIARFFGVCQPHINRIINNKRRKAGAFI
jgi:hypothetical protein